MTTKKTDIEPEIELTLEPLDGSKPAPTDKPVERKLPPGVVERRVRQRRVSADRREVIRFSNEGDRRQLKDRRANATAWEDGYEKT